MRRFACTLTVLSLLFLGIASGHAWDLNLSGQYQYEFKYFSRVGPGDLFGNAEQAQRSNVPGLTTIGLSGPANRIVTPEGFSSKGSDGSYATERFELYPTFIVNPALRLNGIIAFQGSLNGQYVGGPNWAIPPGHAGRYSSDSRSESIYDPVAATFLRALWITADIPWGRFEFGRRPFIFGTGWAGFHGNDTANTSISLTQFSGPFAFTLGAVLADTGEYTDPFDSRNANMTPLTVASSADRNEIRAWNWWAAAIYRNGPFEVGLMNRTIRYNKVHALPLIGNTLRDDQTASFAATFLQAWRVVTTENGNEEDWRIPIYGDVLLMTWPAYVKYFDGRFFLNGEFSLQYLSARREGGRPITGRPYAWMVEGGAVHGPVKATLAGFYRSGADRQGGILDVSSSTGKGQTGTTQVGDSWSQYIVLGGAGSAIEPYTWLIGEYGAGNNSYDAAGRCTFLDFKAFAGRIDYALASNLNLWTSYILAHRASNTGTVWGAFSGGLAPVQLQGPNVAENNLGWEWDIGTSWKLLEGLTWDTAFAYWKPGNWFKTAWVDWSSPTTIDSGLGAVRINPDRNIDPIIGFKTALTITF